MNKMLLAGGCFLLLGFVLMIAGLIMFLIRRKKSPAGTGTQPGSSVPASPVQGQTGPMPVAVPTAAPGSPPFEPPLMAPPGAPSMAPPIAPPIAAPIAPPMAAPFEPPMAPPIAPPIAPPGQSFVPPPDSFAQPTTPAFVPPSVPPDPTVFVNMSATAGGSLRCIAGPLTGQVVPLDETGVIIGRDRNVAQIILEDPRVSKRHVWVGIRGGAVTAVDSSTNGTFLNSMDKRIGEARLNPGDVLIISQDVARFEVQS
jgi:hypothetical protein